MLVTESATLRGTLASDFLAAPTALYPTDSAAMGGYGDTDDATTGTMVNGHAIQHLDHFLSFDLSLPSL